MSDDLYMGPASLAPGPNLFWQRVSRILLIPLTIAFIAIIIVFYVLFSVTAVVGQSMLPTLHDGDRLLLTKSYDTPHRGDIVVFATLDPEHKEEDLVKRVVAIPGDTVEVRQGVAIVNGAVESTSSLLTSPYDETAVAPLVVPAGTVFVLGDNRPIALDSRDMGPIPIATVKGAARYLFLPLARARSFQ